MAPRFEVVAEGPVAEHFKKSVMAAGAADVVEIVVLAAGADAFLRVGGAGVGAFFLAEEDRLELVHAGVGEEKRGVVERDDGRTGDEGVAVLLHEEIEELLADLVGGHWRRNGIGGVGGGARGIHHGGTEDTEEGKKN